MHLLLQFKMVAPKCIICKDKVSERDKGGTISYSQCGRWLHASCTFLPKEMVKYLWNIKESCGHHFWACEGCTIAYASLTSRMTTFEKELTEVKLDVLKNKTTVEKNADKVDTVVKDVEALKKSKKQDKDDIVNAATKAWSLEMCERESKANNVVIYGLDEPPLDIKAGLARKEQDEQSLKDLFADISVNLEDDAIKFSYRLGPMGPEVVEKPRPLNIGLRTKEAREKLFNKARGLKDSADFYNISIIVPDLTKQQRAEDQDLRKEADILNLDMEATEQGN